MIVVVGIPAWRPSPEDTERGSAAGRAVAIATSAVAAGATVELVGKAGEDGAGDRLLLDLARSGVGHAALLRDPGRPSRTVSPEPLGSGPSGREAGSAPGELDADLADLLVDGDEPEGDEATSRSPAAGDGGAPGAPADALVLEAADLELALRYLADWRVVVLAEELQPSAVAVAADAAAYAGARVVAIAAGGSLPGLPADATVLEPPPADPDDAFSRLVGAYVAALDRGEEPMSAFRSATSTLGWEPAS